MFPRSIALAMTLAAALAAIGPAAAEETPFAGTWSPQCAPAAKDVVDNQLSTVVIYSGALKLRDLECRIEGLTKRRTVYDAKLECFRKAADPLAATMRISPLDDGRIHIRIREARFARELHRCGG